MTKPTKEQMALFDQWLDKYAKYFAEIDDYALQSAWWLHGRDSDEMAPPRQMAAWAAVNAEMQARGL